MIDSLDSILAGVLGLACLGVGIYLPIRFFLLLGQVNRLEQALRKLGGAPASGEVPASSTFGGTSVGAAAALPPPLPRHDGATGAADTPERSAGLLVRMRDLGLLPPADQVGENALGAWWTVRVGGVLAVAAVVFLGIWLNLVSTIPPIVRVLEVALIGVGLFWGGLRLARQRPDLGQVVAAAGLAVWQFAAWATYGLDQMRLFDSAASAAMVQFLVAVLVAVLALWRTSKLFGQLAVIFASIAVYLSIDPAAGPWPSAVGAALVAFVGVVLLVRGAGGSAGVLGLMGSQACLLSLYVALPTQAANTLPLQLAAAASFLILWVGERLVKDDAVLSGRSARAAFQLASFLIPALLTLFVANGGEQARATASLLIAAVAALAGLAERERHRMVSEILLLAAVGFTAAGLAWLVDPRLVWLIWALAAAAAVIVGTRTGSELVRWSAEGLAIVAAISFILYPPAASWVGLAGVAALGALLTFREDWSRGTAWLKGRRFIGILALAVVVLQVQSRLPFADTGWPWIVLLLLAMVRHRPALLWAAAPGYVVTAFLIVFRLRGGDVSPAWAAGWAALIVILNGAALWSLKDESGRVLKASRQLLALVTAVVGFAFVHHGLGVLPASLSEQWAPSAWRPALTWCLGAALLVALTSLGRRRGLAATDLAWTAFGGLAGYVVQSLLSRDGFGASGLAQSPLILLGLAGFLQVLSAHTREQGAWGTVQRSVLGAAALFFLSFPMLADLPGAGVSLFWALAAVLTFVLGRQLGTRTFRMLGLIGLGLASIRVLTYDITDLVGRIVACGVLAVAFLGIAWLYGRLTADQRDA